MKYPNPRIPTGKTGYYVTLQFPHVDGGNGKGNQFKRSLKTADKRVAKSRIKTMVDDFRAEGFVAPSRRNQIEKIGEVVAMYRQGVKDGLIDITKNAAAAVVQTLYRVLNATHTKEAIVPRQKLSEATTGKLDKMRIDDAFTGPVSDTYMQVRLETNMAGMVKEDDPVAYHIKLDKTKRSIDDELRRAHAIFGVQARPYYEKHHNFDCFKIKEAKAFNKEPNKFDKTKTKKSAFKAPTQKVYELLLAFINSLKVVDPDAWITMTLCLSAGTRGKEVYNSMKSFFKVDRNNPAITNLCLPHWTTKTLDREIPMATSVVQEIFRVAAQPKKAGKRGANRHRDEQFIIGGEQVLERCRRLLADEFGTTLQNDDDDGRLHTLRKIFGSKILSRTRDIAYTSKLLGHKNIQTTIDVYADHDNTVEPTVIVDIMQPQVAVVKESKVA